MKNHQESKIMDVSLESRKRHNRETERSVIADNSNSKPNLGSANASKKAVQRSASSILNDDDISIVIAEKGNIGARGSNHSSRSHPNKAKLANGRPHVQTPSSSSSNGEAGGVCSKKRVWSCDFCTFLNSTRLADCSICLAPRPLDSYSPPSAIPDLLPTNETVYNQIQMINRKQPKVTPKQSQQSTSQQLQSDSNKPTDPNINSNSNKNNDSHRNSSKSSSIDDSHEIPLLMDLADEEGGEGDDDGLVCHVCGSECGGREIMECSACGSWRCCACPMFVSKNGFQDHLETHENILHDGGFNGGYGSYDIDDYDFELAVQTSTTQQSSSRRRGRTSVCRPQLHQQMKSVQKYGTSATASTHHLPIAKPHASNPEPPSSDPLSPSLPLGLGLGLRGAQAPTTRNRAHRQLHPPRSSKYSPTDHRLISAAAMVPTTTGANGSDSSGRSSGFETVLNMKRDRLFACDNRISSEDGSLPRPLVSMPPPDDVGNSGISSPSLPVAASLVTETEPQVATDAMVSSEHPSKREVYVTRAKVHSHDSSAPSTPSVIPVLASQSKSTGTDTTAASTATSTATFKERVPAAKGGPRASYRTVTAGQEPVTEITGKQKSRDDQEQSSLSPEEKKGVVESERRFTRAALAAAPRAPPQLGSFLVTPTITNGSGATDTATVASTGTSATSDSGMSKEFTIPIEVDGMAVCPSVLDIGCGTLNPLNNRRCKGCSQLLRTKENAMGDKMRLGQVVHFLRLNGTLIDKGIIVGIGVGDQPDTVLIRYYEKCFRVPRYDEIISINNVYASITGDVNVVGSRARKQTVVFEFKPEPKRLRKEKGATELDRDRDGRSKAGSSTGSVQSCEDGVSSAGGDDVSERSDDNGDGEVEEGGCVGGAEVVDEEVEVDVDDDNADSSPPYDGELRKSFLGLPIDNMDRHTIFQCVRFPPARCAEGRLDRFQQRALLHFILDWNMPLTTHSSAGLALDSSSKRHGGIGSGGHGHGHGRANKKTKREGGALADPKPVLHLQLLEEVLAGCPVDVSELSQIPSAKPLLEPGCPKAFRDLVSGLLLTVHTFLVSRELRPTATVKSGLKVLGARQEVPQLLEDTAALGIKELRAMKLSLPLTYYQFNLAMRLAYERMGGRDALEGRRGVRGVELTENGQHAMYGGIRENLIEEVLQRGRVRKSSVFLDIGSGIGQVCIQAAATIGCKSFGIEVIAQRHETGLSLLCAFETILKEAGVCGSISHLVHLKRADFTGEDHIVSTADCIFLNNFGPWFSSQHPDKGRDLNSIFATQIISMKTGSHILTMNPLVDASTWLFHRVFMSPPVSSTWNNQRLAIYHYTILSKQWTCPVCTLVNEAWSKNCEVCAVRNKTVRNKGVERARCNR